MPSCPFCATNLSWEDIDVEEYTSPGWNSDKMIKHIKRQHPKRYESMDLQELMA